MTDDYENRIAKNTERFLQSSFSLWNAILTINGILLAALSFVKLDDRNGNNLILVITILCVISIMSIVYNFFAAKSTYYRLIEVMHGTEELTKEVKSKDIKIALARRKRIIFSEKSSLILLVIESFLVLGLVGIRFFG